MLTSQVIIYWEKVLCLVMQLKQGGKFPVNQVILVSIYPSKMIWMSLDLEKENKHCLASGVSFN